MAGSMSGLELGYNVQGVALIVIIALLALLYFLGAQVVLSAPRRRRFWTPYRRSRFEKDFGQDLKDVGNQLHAVMAAPFQKRQVFNHSEYHVFKIIEDEIAAAHRGYRVFAQTSLGEVLASPDSNAFLSINSKRVDILIVDWGGWPVVAVEYQGSGHYQGTAAARDAVKKEALRKAGVRYIEVCPSDSDEQIRSRVREQLGWKPLASTNSGNSYCSTATPTG
jgi:hypothetical protein